MTTVRAHGRVPPEPKPAGPGRGAARSVEAPPPPGHACARRAPLSRWLGETCAQRDPVPRGDAAVFAVVVFDGEAMVVEAVFAFHTPTAADMYARMQKYAGYLVVPARFHTLGNSGSRKSDC